MELRHSVSAGDSGVISYPLFALRSTGLRVRVSTAEGGAFLLSDSLPLIIQLGRGPAWQSGFPSLLATLTQ